jgi:ABC-type Zn uptake system ZnuABC Zn-binding protein ZnuA
MRDTVASMTRGVDVLKGVNDEEAAIEARPKLTQMQKELKASKAKLEKLDPPNEKEMARLATKYEGELDRLSSEFEREIRRISTDRNIAKHLVGATSLP